MGQDFWSRRKAAVLAEAEAQAQAAAPGPEPTPEAAPEDDAALLERLGLPDPDTLEQGDDFAAFLTQAVPHHIRNRALRRLWLSNPVLANVDGLVDYAEDFTDAATVLPGMQTAYQVGKGMTQHVMKMLEEAEAAAAAEQAPEEEAPEEAAPEEAAPVPEELAPPAAPEVMVEAPARPRHMRFDIQPEAQI